MLTLIKLTHTIIWAVMAAAIYYILYAGIFGHAGPLLWWCVALMVAETLALSANKMACPLTPLAGRYTDDRQANFDIYLPLWLARHNKTIFGPVLIIGLALVIFRVLSN